MVAGSVCRVVGLFCHSRARRRTASLGRRRHSGILRCPARENVANGIFEVAQLGEAVTDRFLETPLSLPKAMREGLICSSAVRPFLQKLAIKLKEV